MKIKVYVKDGKYDFWTWEADRAVELELAEGYNQGLSKFGKTCIVGPGTNEYLHIEDAIAKGVARVVE